MNIFFLHLDPRTCAQYHLDKHVVKMILESCQLLCTAHWVHPNGTYTPPYKITHKNHPSAIWTRASLSNYLWLCKLALELCSEYTFRYGKIHKCQPIAEELLQHYPQIQDIGFTTPALAMPDTYKCVDAVESYRAYYLFEKTKILTWKKRSPPPFYEELLYFLK